MKKITIKGKYTGINKRGLTVGGVPMRKDLPAKRVEVDEVTYKRLLEGEKNGWFEITEDNYAEYLGITGEVTAPKEVKEETIEETIEEATEEATEEAIEKVKEEATEETEESATVKKAKRTAKKKEEDK